MVFLANSMYVLKELIDTTWQDLNQGFSVLETHLMIYMIMNLLITTNNSTTRSLGSSHHLSNGLHQRPLQHHTLTPDLPTLVRTLTT